MISKQKLYAMKYLRKEYDELQINPLMMNIGCTVGLINNDIFHWKIFLTGPNDSPYAGGLFTLTVDFNEDYPYSRPEIRFVNKIYHLNISPSNGHVSISILNAWKEKTPVSEIICNIFVLFYVQNPYGPYNIKMAREYELDRNEFNRKAKEWTQKYATIKI